MIKAEHIGQAIDQVLADNRQSIVRLTADDTEDLSWEGFVLAPGRSERSLESGQASECRMQHTRTA